MYVELYNENRIMHLLNFVLLFGLKAGFHIIADRRSQ